MRRPSGTEPLEFRFSVLKLRGILSCMGQDWDKLAAGDGCPFDSPRPDQNQYWDLIKRLGVASLYLSRDQTYRGQCLLIYDPRHVIRPDQLGEDEWAVLSQDLYRAQAAIMASLQPDHINLASLGNVVPHLHWHLIPRYKTDPRWGSPIWLTRLMDMPTAELTAEDRIDLIASLRAAIG